MKKTFLAGAFIMSFCMALIAQNTNPIVPLAAGCDTINFPAPAIWGGRNALQYQINPTGYVTGTNGLNDKEVAHFFDLSATANTFLTRLWIYFSAVDVSAAGKSVNIKVYDGTTNSPGTLLRSIPVTLADLRIDYVLNDKSDFLLSPALSLPASKKFFVAVDFSSLSWNSDTLAVSSSLSGRTPARAWIKTNTNSWLNLGSDGFALSLFVHPFVSTNTNCEITTPVKLEGLKGTATKVGNELEWYTASEIQNKGFDILYSTDGIRFESVGFVKSAHANGSSQQRTRYSFLHVQPAAKAWYRLKQTDINGDSRMSTILVIENGNDAATAAMRIVPNPAKSRLQIIWKEPARAGEWVRLTDAQGKTIRQMTVATAATQTVVDLQGVVPGIYYLQWKGPKGLTASQKCWVE